MGLGKPRFILRLGSCCYLGFPILISIKFSYTDWEAGVVRGGGGANVGTLAFDPATLEDYLLVS